jgi:hypothetical protein
MTSNAYEIEVFAKDTAPAVRELVAAGRADG